MVRSRRPSLTPRFASAAASVPEAAPSLHPEPEPARTSRALTPDELLAARQVVPTQAQAERTAEGLVFVPVRESFALRGERLRAVSPEGDGFKPSPLKRRVRGRETEEGFAGTGSSWVLLEGRGLLVLEPSAERELMLLRLAGEFVYLREARLVGFEGAERALTVRAGSVLGWTGRLLGQAVPAEQAPHLGSGFVAFSGDGSVLVDDP